MVAIAASGAALGLGLKIAAAARFFPIAIAGWLGPLGAIDFTGGLLNGLFLVWLFWLRLFEVGLIHFMK